MAAPPHGHDRAGSTRVFQITAVPLRSSENTNTIFYSETRKNVFKNRFRQYLGVPDDTYSMSLYSEYPALVQALIDDCVAISTFVAS